MRRKKVERIALIVGAGAVENAWNPILKAIEKVYYITTTPDGANCLFAREIYFARYFASRLPKAKKDLEAILFRIKLLKGIICLALEEARKNGEIRARKELKYIIQKFIFLDNVAAMFVSANWDTVVNDEIQRILKLKTNKLGMEIHGFHIHGSIDEFEGLYLPSEHANELYRAEEETKVFEEKTALFLHNVEMADKAILYGLSLDPLDAELSQTIASCCNSRKLKEVIIVNPDYNKVAERLKVLTGDECTIKISCYNPEDLENAIAFN